MALAPFTKPSARSVPDGLLSDPGLKTRKKGEYPIVRRVKAIAVKASTKGG
jgi:hypothetical protein